MICKSIQQFAIVQGDTAQQLTDQLNAELVRLQDKNPTVSFEGLIARIQYTEKETIPETLAEEYEAKGIRLTCEDCPYFCPAIKADGTQDLRAKWGGCPWAEYGRAKKSARVCDKLFELINNGEVKLCINGK